jgi:hypothetical protein
MHNNYVKIHARNQWGWLMTGSIDVKNVDPMNKKR